MDSYQSANQPPNPRPKTGPLRQGTGMLNADSFQSGTGRLGGPQGTRRLASGPLEAESTLAAFQIEAENGKVITEKLAPRIVVLKRALALVANPTDARILAGVGAGEAGFTKQVAGALGVDAGLKRRAQVAVYQYDQALAGVQKADLALAEIAGLAGPEKFAAIDTHCTVEKLRGQLYPLINLHAVFRDSPIVAQLLPPPKVEEPKAPSPEDYAAFMPPPEAVAVVPEAPRSVTGKLATTVKQDPAVQEIVKGVKALTGRLFGGAFGAK